MDIKEKRAGYGKWISLVKGICLCVALMLNAVCVQLLVEVAIRMAYSDAMFWWMAHSAYVVAGLGMIFFVSLAMFLLVKRAAAAVAITNGFFFLLTVADHYVTQLRGDRFTFADVMQVREAAQVVGNFEFAFPSKYLIAVGIILVMVIPCIFVGMRVNVRGWKHLLCAMIACTMCGLYFDAYHQIGSDVIWWDREGDYRERGFLLGFANTMPGLFDSTGLDKPQGYSSDAVRAVLAENEQPIQSTEILPDVLMIMSESLYDLQQTGRYSLTEEPMPYFKAMQETYAGGRLITPQYGGGTAQVEYEVFTGYRSSETQGMAFVNRHIIKAGMDSVVTALKRHGYYTQAMHPNVGSFYDRVYAYDAIGFDQLDFSDTMEGVEESATLTPYPSDEYLFGQIIKAYEERPKDQPWMCYALTYQNHGGYDYEGMTNRIQALDMPEGKEKRSLENYVNALHVSDEALRELLAYFEQQERPMMVIVWGDHSPNQKFFGVEMEAGVEKTELDYTTPYLVWSNYDLDTEALPDTLAAYRLGAYVLRLAGLGGDPYMDYLSSDGAANLFPAYGMLEEAGQVFVDEERYEEAVQQMRLLHYDRLDGENYGRGCP